MPNLDLARQLLYYSPALLQSLIVWRMTVTGSRRNFPIFYSYLIFQTAALIVGHLVISFGAGMQYRYFYSAQMLVGVTLLFAVIYEIFSNVFRPYEALHDFARVMFRWAGLVLALVALLQAFSTQAGQGDRLIVALVIAERSVVVIACGLLLFLLLFSKNLGLDWKHQAFGVATGFGLFCGIELILLTSQLLFGCPMGPTLNRLRASAWLCVVILWVYYMFGPERAHKTAEAFAPKLILERWNQVLRSVNRPAPQGSFMPNLEKIVDDVLAHQPTTGIVH
jgi:hypothetical protein